MNGKPNSVLYRKKTITKTVTREEYYKFCSPRIDKKKKTSIKTNKQAETKTLKNKEKKLINLYLTAYRNSVIVGAHLRTYTREVLL